MTPSIRPSIVFLLFSTLFFAQITPVFSQFICLPLESTTRSGSITTADPTQNGRVVRNGITSTCTGKSTTLQNSVVVHADSYPFNAPTGSAGCVRIDFNFLGCGTNQTQIVAYSNYNPASPAANVIGDPGLSSTGIGSFSFPYISGQQFTVAVHEIGANTGCESYNFKVEYSTGCRQAGFDSDDAGGAADVAVYRPTTGDWYIYGDINTGTGTRHEYFGAPGDIPMPADHTGDGVTDSAVYRPADYTWYLGNDHVDPAHNFTAVPWGAPGDVPVPADYDGDGVADIAIFRTGDGTFYVRRSTDGTLQAFQWGTSGDIPVSGDFDGDRRWDFAVFRPSESIWYVRQSNFDYAFTNLHSWGLPSDTLVPADYDGDSRTDVGVYRDGYWYFRRSGIPGDPGAVTIWGQAGDTPVPADYDGDRKADPTVVRDDHGSLTWFMNLSDGDIAAIQWGLASDTPVSSAGVPRQ